MRLTAKILLCLLIAYGLAFYMTVPANPEVAFWREVDKIRNQELQSVRRSDAGKPVIIFTGGSSCAFSIDPAIIEKECGIPALNVGLPFSAGPKYLLDQALRKARSGDILVIALEPDSIVYHSEFNPSSFSFALAALEGHPSAAIGRSSFGENLKIRDYLTYSRPGPTYMATWLGKAATGKGYRYTTHDIRYRGRLETAISEPNLISSMVIPPEQISSSGKDLLTRFRDSAKSRGVTVLYCMPWLLTAKEIEADARFSNGKILKAIEEIVPILDDGHQGVVTDPAYFSDTTLHLSATGSAIRSQAVAKQIQKWLSSRD